jgi:outer membrane receptor protein involved in Fe transport
MPAGWLDGRLRTQVGVGTDSSISISSDSGARHRRSTEGVRFSLQFTGALAQANWQLAPKSPWAVGLRYVYADVDPKPRDSTFQSVADRVRVKVSAPTAVVEFDTRDNVFTPTRGIYAESSVARLARSPGRQ